MALSTMNASRKRRMMSDMNVVPYIDVMLVLVVILMVAAPFVNPSVVNLPRVQKASTAPQNPVEVIVYADHFAASLNLYHDTAPVKQFGERQPDYTPQGAENH